MHGSACMWLLCDYHTHYQYDNAMTMHTILQGADADWGDFQPGD